MQNLQLPLKILHSSLLQPVLETEMRSILMVYVLPTVLTHTQMFLCTVQPIVT